MRVKSPSSVYLGWLLVVCWILAADQTRAASTLGYWQETETNDPAVVQENLKFNFDDQPWPDVLNWFARQAGLSLVINDFPAGGFTFRDTRAYTAAESIDLLNSVLLTKNYTLVRKDAMLILINTTQGVPYDLIPEKKLNELAACGRFELVTVTFPLEGRPVDTVRTEVQPLIGALGRVSPLAATGQLMVTETAGRMQAIQALIESIPKPRAPEKPKPKPDPPPQVLKTYTITDLSLTTTADFLKSAIGGARITVDEPTQQMFMYATEKQHEDVEVLLSRLREGARPAELSVESYRYTTSQPTVLVEQLKTLVPGVIWQIDAAQNRLLAIGDSQQQAKAAMALETIEGPAPTQLTLKSYSIPQRAQAAATEAIQKIVPGISITPHSSEDRLLIIAAPGQHQQIAEVISQLSEAGVVSSNEDQTLVSFDLQHKTAAEALVLLKALLPDVEWQSDAKQNRLLAVLDANQQAQVQGWLQAIDKAPDPATKMLVQVYPASPEVFKRLDGLLTRLLPEVQATYEADNRQILVTAVEEDQQRFSELLEMVDRAPNPETQVVVQVYESSPEAYQRLSTLLGKMLPEVQATFEADNRQILVTATPEDQQRFKEMLEMVTQSLPAAVAIQTYPVPKDAQATATEALRQLVPEIKVTADAVNDRLVVYATAADHARVVAALQQITDAGLLQASPKQVLRVFSLSLDQQRGFAAIQSSLPAELATVRVLPGADPASLIVWGTPLQLEQLAEILDSLATVGDTKNERVLGVYPVAAGDAKVAGDLLTRLFPTVEIQVDLEGNRIVAWGTAEQLQQVKQATQQLAATASDGWERNLRTYVVRDIDLTLVSQTISPLVPDLTISLDRTSNQLIAYGREKDHLKLQELLDQLKASGPSNTKTMKVYEVGDQDPIILAGLLGSVAPQAKIATQRGAQGIAIWATEEEHQQIAETFTQLKDLETEQRRLRILAVPHTGAATAVLFLRGAARDGLFFPAADGLSVFAFAVEEDLTKSEQIILELERQNSRPNETTLKTYRYPAAVLKAAQPLLASRVPRAEPMPTTVDDQWMVWASSEDHAKITSLLENLAENLPKDTDFQLRLYRLEQVAVTDAQAAIASLVGTVTYLSGSEPGQLRIWTDGPKHQKVATLLQQLEEQLGQTDSPQPLKVYPIESRTSVALVVQNLAPDLLSQANVVQNPERNALLVRATEEIHQRLQAAIDEFLAALPDAPERVPRSYPLQYLTPTAAVSLLTTLVPQATYAIDAINNKVAATALEEQHAEIAAALAQLDVATERDLSTRAYRVPLGYGAAIGTSLVPLYPEAKITWDVSGSVLLVVATAEMHTELDRVLREILEGSLDDSTTEFYVLSVANPAGALAMIKQVYPRTQGTLDLETNSIVVTASPREHEGIAALLQKLESAGQGRQVIAYPLRKTAPAIAQASVVAAFPKIKISVDLTRDLLIVTGTEAEQSGVRELLDTLEQGPDKPTLAAKSYDLKHLTAPAALPLLQTLVPQATYAIDAVNNKIAVTAKPEQQAEIAAALVEIDVPRQESLETKAYRVPTGYASAISASLVPLYPQAKITTDYSGSVLVITARDTTHTEIDRVVTEILEGSESSTETKVYRLNQVDASTVTSLFKQVLPRAQVASDPATGSLVVTASANDQTRFATLLEQLEQTSGDQQVVVYAVRLTSTRAASAAVQRIAPRASVTSDWERDALVVSASAEDHERIRTLIQQLETKTSDSLTTKAYRLQAGDPRSAEDALDALLPTATFSADVRAGVLWATAEPEEHQLIAKVIEELEVADQESTRVQAFPVERGDVEELYGLLRRLYANDDSVRLSRRDGSRTLLFVGPPKQELAIRQIIDQWTELGSQDSGREIKVYDLAELDGDVLVESLEKLLEDQTPPPDLQVQYSTNRLLAIATPSQQSEIVGALEELRGEGRKLEVFNLQVNTPETVEDAIRQLFLDLPFSASPSVNSSNENQQLFVRATETQLQQIRDLLIKLGEPADGSAPRMGASAGGVQIRGQGNLRVIAAPNATELLQQIQTLWPQISPNPLKVVTPESESTLPGLGPSNSDDSDDTSSGSAPGQTSGPNEPTVSTPEPTDPPASRVTTSVALSAVQTPADQDSVAPVLVFPRGDELTIASSDPAALAIMEQLFRLLIQQQTEERKVEISGNFTIFRLNNAGAAEMAATVSRLFQQMTASQSRGRSRDGNANRVSIVPDERLNSLVVYGSPSDRKTIESLIQVLDTSDELSTAKVNEPRIVKVENVLADKILGILETVYRSQLRPDQPPRIQIPAGVSVDVAVALREANAAATAPLLTLEVDQATNSIIVLASERLGAEVESLIHRLDQQHKSSNTQGFRVIALEKGNTQRIEDTLRRLIRDYQRRR